MLHSAIANGQAGPLPLAGKMYVYSIMPLWAFLPMVQIASAFQRHQVLFSTHSDSRCVGFTRLCSTPISVERTASRDIASFQNWAVENGVQPGEGFCLNDYMMDGNEEYYAATSTGGSQGSLALFVPGEMILSATQTYQEIEGAIDDSMQILKARGMEHLSQQFVLFLKVLFLYQEGEQSSYYPWMASLPRKWNTAVSMDEFCLSCLPPYIKAVCNAEREQFQIFREALQPFAYLNSETKNDDDVVRFAYNVVTTRSVPSPKDDDVKIIPVVDMLNHGNPSNAELAYDENGGCGVLLTSDVEPGQPLLLNYGDESNPSRLLAKYGFLADSPTAFCKLYFPNPSRELIEVGYDPAQMLFNTQTGDVSQAVWDVLLYSRIERKPDLANVAQQFHQACTTGDEETKLAIHNHYFSETCNAMLRHVNHILIEVHDLTVQMNAYDSSKHPRLPLLRKHHEMVTTTFQKVQANLEQMLKQ